jgi:EAL domain-containing protein (putative c-di-GMP-specific phosphodiesterase class I)
MQFNVGHANLQIAYGLDKWSVCGVCQSRPGGGIAIEASTRRAFFAIFCIDAEGFFWATACVEGIAHPYAICNHLQIKLDFTSRVLLASTRRQRKTRRDGVGWKCRHRSDGASFSGSRYVVGSCRGIEMSLILQFSFSVFSGLRLFILKGFVSKWNLIDVLRKSAVPFSNRLSDWAFRPHVAGDVAHIASNVFDSGDRSAGTRHPEKSEAADLTMVARSKEICTPISANLDGGKRGLPLSGSLSESVNDRQTGWNRNELYQAILKRQFVPYFQPKVELATGRSTCVEVLARWDHPDLGIIEPSEFIETMEQGALIDELTVLLLHKSLKCVRKVAARGWRIGLAINFSPLTLQNADIPDYISMLLKHYDVRAEQITIEVTETAISSNIEGVLESLTRLRRLGCKISIDDFGIGYSTLKFLSQMPFTEIKIDRMFVSGFAGDEKSAIILESVVKLADKLRMRTVAEGIETKRELDFMQSVGCTAGQGFYFSRPLACRNLMAYFELNFNELAPALN